MRLWGRRSLSTLRGPQVESRILAQDLLVELAERAARLDPELVDEGGPRRLIGLERLGLAPCPVEGEHQLGAEVLAQRMLPGESVELADEVRMSSLRKIPLDPLLEAGKAELL